MRLIRKILFAASLLLADAPVHAEPTHLAEVEDVTFDTSQSIIYTCTDVVYGVYAATVRGHLDASLSFEIAYPSNGQIVVVTSTQSLADLEVKDDSAGPTVEAFANISGAPAPDPDAVVLATVKVVFHDERGGEAVSDETTTIHAVAFTSR